MHNANLPLDKTIYDSRIKSNVSESISTKSNKHTEIFGQSEHET